MRYVSTSFSSTIALYFSILSCYCSNPLMMANFMCQHNWSTGCSGIWLTIISGDTVNLFLVGINTCFSSLSKTDPHTLMWLNLIQSVEQLNRTKRQTLPEEMRIPPAWPPWTPTTASSCFGLDFEAALPGSWARSLWTRMTLGSLGSPACCSPNTSWDLSLKNQVDALLIINPFPYK